MSNQQDTKKKNPNVPNLRFSGFTEEWQIESADSLFEVIPNNTISRDGLSYESGTWKNIHYGDILTLFPTLLDVNDARVPYISSASFNSKTALSSGDVVIADTAEDYTAGKALEVTGAEDIKTVPGLHTIACHPTRTFASGFLGYYLNSYAYRERIKPFIQGIKVYSISKGNFLRSALSFPSIPEQAKIGCFLSLLDQRIEVQNKIIEEREASIKAIFLSLDVGAKQKICLRDVGEYKACDNLSWDEIGVTGRPAIIYGELFTAYRYLINTVRSRTMRNLKSVSTGNDLLFPSSTTVDAISLIAPAALMQQGVVLGGDMFSIAVKDDIDPIYLSFLINCRYKKALSKYAQGSTIIHIHYDDIKRFPMELVSTQKQRKISAVMSSYLSLIEKEKTKLALFRREKEFFLRNMFI